MTAEEALAAAGVPESLAAVRRHWANSMAVYPAEGSADLSEAGVSANLAACGFDHAVVAALLPTAALIREDPALSRLAWHLIWSVFEAPPGAQPASDGWPRLPQLGDHWGHFNLLAAAALAPRLRAYHQRLGFPAAATVETLQQVRCYQLGFADAHGGRLGAHPWQLSWLGNYCRHPYVRCGRMEFWHRPCGHRLTVFRHRQSGQVMALAPAGEHYDGGGFVDGRAGLHDAEQGWTATCTEAGGVVTGHPIDPRGTACRQPVALALTDWQRVLEAGAPVLDIHIPSGGGLTLAACAESFQRAADFFTTHLPAQPPAAFVCSSWVFDPQWAALLPPTANLARLPRELYLFPVPSTGYDCLRFLFYQTRIDPATARRDTSMRRVVADHLLAGGLFRSGGMFLLLDDIGRFGRQPYLSQAR